MGAFRNRLQTRLTILTLIVAIPLLAGVVGVIIERAGAQMTDDANDHLRMTNRVLRTNTSTWLDLNVRALQELATLPEVISMDPAQQKPVLEAMQAAYPYMYLISTTNLDGLNVARSDAQDPIDYNDRPWFQSIRDGAPLAYQSLIGRTTGKPALVVSTPIKDADGNLVGVGMFAADLASITAETVASRVGDTGYSYIVDGSNLAIAHPNEAYTTVELHDLSQDKPIVALRSGQTGIYNFTDGQGHTWRAYLDTLDNGWGIIVQQRVDEVLDPLHLFQRVALAALVLGVLLIMVLLWLAIGRAVRPVGDLTRAASAIAGGDLSRTVEVNRRDEIGLLAQSFNSMTVQLRDLIGGLEDRVTARTRDLQVASDVSRQITTQLKLDDLLNQIVTLTVQRFKFYAALVFLLVDGDRLVPQAGADSQGRSLDRDLFTTIPLDADPSLIALAARSRQAVNIDDVTQSNAFMPVAAVPDTRSELAIPLVLGRQVLGVFDVQSEKVGRFTPEDRSILTALAEQITIAVRNAQSFAETETARREAEQANKVKSQFLAAMSHELRTPLNAILNFTQFVSSGMMGPVTERQKGALDKTVISAEHLLDLINDVLDISKIEAGALQLFVEENVNVTEELQFVISTGQSMLEDKPIQLVTDIGSDLPLIRADKQRVRQIILNLMSNACKFTDSGTITLQAHAHDGHILIAVRDTGPGIPPEDQEAIFVPFQQTGVGLKKGGGTGLGLTISRRLAEAHGGSLWVESTPGQGAAFYVKLPVVSATAPTLVGEKLDVNG